MKAATRHRSRQVRSANGGVCLYALNRFGFAGWFAAGSDIHPRFYDRGTRPVIAYPSHRSCREIVAIGSLARKRAGLKHDMAPQRLCCGRSSRVAGRGDMPPIGDSSDGNSSHGCTILRIFGRHAVRCFSTRRSNLSLTFQRWEALSGRNPIDRYEVIGQ